VSFPSNPTSATGPSNPLAFRLSAPVPPLSVASSIDVSEALATVLS
jgi:hypothetical protein